MDISNVGVRSQKAAKGVSLIIAVFTMMILAVLGLTLAMMISGDFEMNTRNLESEQAFYLADSGIQDALMHLTLVPSGDVAFSNDAAYLNRRLANGEYNVTREINGGEINITSNGYISNQANYRARRQVKIIALPPAGLGNTAFTGGDWFDWHRTNSITVNGDIAAANYEGNDTNTTWNQNEFETTWSDFAVPGSGSRIRSTAPLPEINMTWFYDNRETYSPGDVEITDKNVNSVGIWFIEGNAILNATSKKIVAEHTYIIARKNITIKGGNSVVLKTGVQPSDKAYPVLATQYGNITIDPPTGLKAIDRKFDGVIYTQFGKATINCIDGVAVMGYWVELRNNIVLKYDPKYVDMSHGFTSAGGGETIRSWQEQ